MKYQIKNILVPTDFSECANNALRVAIGMAKRHNATLHLINAYDITVPTISASAIPFNLETSPNLFVEVENRLKKLRDEVIKHLDSEVIIFADLGSVSSVVRKYFENNNIDLVVMGTHGASGFKEYFAGTNTYDVIKTTSCPVISIPLSFESTGFNNVLYPIRAVDGVVEKYDFIKPILDKNDSKIHLLALAYENDMQERYLVNVDFEKVKKLIEHDERYMTFEAIQTNDIADTILTVANKRSDDLMIINATLDKKWYQFFKGNYTQKIINHSRIPIMAIKPELTPQEAAVAYQYLVAEANYYTPLTLQPIY